MIVYFVHITLHTGRECQIGNFCPCHYYPGMCTRPRAQHQSREGWKGLHLSCSQTIQKHSPYVETSCIKHRLSRLPATWPVPCTAPGPECTARGRREWSQGETVKGEWGESRLCTASQLTGHLESRSGPWSALDSHQITLPALKLRGALDMSEEAI